MKNGRYTQCLLWNFKAQTPIYLRGKYTNNRAKNMKFDSIFLQHAWLALSVFIHIQIVLGFWEHLFFFGAIR